jgi:NADPH:quinone reductase-like Zn-dependent oxidoreductase
MKAVVYQEPYKVTVEEMPDPKIEAPHDAVVRPTSTCICGSDPHIYDGRMGAEAGLVLGHESQGVVEAVGYQAHRADGAEDHVIALERCIKVAGPGGEDERARQGAYLISWGAAWMKRLTLGIGPANMKKYNRHLRDLRDLIGVGAT